MEKKDCFDTVICSKSGEDTKLQKLEPNWTFLFYIINSKFTHKTWYAKFSMQPLTTEYHFQMDILFLSLLLWERIYIMACSFEYLKQVLWLRKLLKSGS